MYVSAYNIKKEYKNFAKTLVKRLNTTLVITFAEDGVEP